MKRIVENKFQKKTGRDCNESNRHIHFAVNLYN